MTTYTPKHHKSSDLIQLFSECFASSHNTTLVGNAEEPLYTPALKDNAAQIHFRADYFSSALHEIAHWCIAGEERRAQVDYGYWYIADGRDKAQQTAFFDVEVKPQALEWLFSEACNYPFTVSVDNVVAGEQQADWSYWEELANATDLFQARCLEQIHLWFETELPKRGYEFMAKLASYYRDGHMPTFEDISAVECKRKHV